MSALVFVAAMRYSAHTENHKPFILFAELSSQQGSGNNPPRNEKHLKKAFAFYYHHFQSISVWTGTARTGLSDRFGDN